MELSKFIRNYLDKNDLSQRELARRCGLSPQTVTNALRGENAIDTETMAKFANGMGYPNARYALINGVSYIEVPELPKVRNDDSEITAFQMKFAALDAHGKRIVSDLLDAEYERCTGEAAETRTKIIPLFPAAAGAGEPMATTAFQEYEVEADSKAQFAVRVSGDSMEPELHDGEIVLCEKRRAKVGELAVIMVNGFLLVKQYIDDGFGNIYLRSLNRERKDLDYDILASGNDTVTGYGVVIHRHLPLVRQ